MGDGSTAGALNRTRSFYDRISHAYDLIADSSEHVARERGICALAVAPGERILVIGYGTGHSLVALAHAAGVTGRVFGVDISEGMLSVARDRIVHEDVADRVDITLADARHLPYGNGVFDAVFIAFTLELFDDHDIPQVLTQIRGVLRRRGRLGVVAMAKGAEDSVMTEIYLWMHHHFPHWVDCRPISLDRWLSQTDFVMLRAETLSLWRLPVAVVVARSPG
jgi:demethylmenaquinone methyltransferase/2-methoxy-6-polyprenyl-1,4-benzoquinol methylase